MHFSLINTQVGFPQFLTIMNKTIMNINTQNLCKYKFLFLWHKCLRVQQLQHL